MRNKVLHFILISLYSAFSKLHLNSCQTSGPRKILKLRPAPRNQTHDFTATRQTLYFTTLETTSTICHAHNPEKDSFWKHNWKRRKCCTLHFLLFTIMFSTLPLPNFDSFCCLQQFWIWTSPIFVAFAKDNATMSSIQYFENHVSYFVQNQRTLLNSFLYNK